MTKGAKDEDSIDYLKSHLALMEQEIVKSEAIFNSMGEGVVVTDEYGYIVKINKLLLKMFNYKQKDVIGKRYVDVFIAVNEDGSLINLMDRPISRIFRNGKPISEKTYYLDKNNTPIPFGANISPVLFEGSPIGAIQFFRDLREEYMKEKIQSEFISMASHQLRTPLALINTYSQMLTNGYSGDINEQQAGFLAIIENAASNMNELIDTLLNVTRIEAGNIAVNIRSVDINELCREVIGYLKPMAKEKGISISFRSDFDVINETDPTLLREILSNLISNAIKYTPKKGRVSLKVDVKERLIFTVKDNGYGIPKKSHDYVFSKYYRAKNAATTDTSGTGIGLYLAKLVSEQLEGDIWFKSQVGEGTVFYFSLPLVGSASKQGKFTLQTETLGRKTYA